MKLLVTIALGLGIAAFLQLFVLAGVLYWSDQHTRGIRYYGLPPEGRRRFKRTLRWWAWLLHPIIVVQGRMTKVSFDKARFQFKGVAGPRGACDEASFENAHRYEPDPSDVFVVTQMRCGTTWMQHVVYETLHRGAGELVAGGRALYAVSPWLEGLRSVSMEDAPALGNDRPSRLIKTHFPATLCPFAVGARYIYVMRHPVSCFASCYDFLKASLGRFTPDVEAVAAWFCSEEDMWWGTWATHVAGWWELAQRESNILIVQFEEMKQDLKGTVERVAEHLGVSPLTESELEAVVAKCGFDYMSANAETFEMAPPHILSVDAEIFVSGRVDRQRDVPESVAAQVGRWAAKSMGDSGFPIKAAYPNLSDGSAG